MCIMWCFRGVDFTRFCDNDFQRLQMLEKKEVQKSLLRVIEPHGFVLHLLASILAQLAALAAELHSIVRSPHNCSYSKLLKLLSKASKSSTKETNSAKHMQFAVCVFVIFSTIRFWPAQGLCQGDHCQCVTIGKPSEHLRRRWGGIAGVLWGCSFWSGFQRLISIKLLWIHFVMALGTPWVGPEELKLQTQRALIPGLSKTNQSE